MADAGASLVGNPGATGPAGRQDQQAPRDHQGRGRVQPGRTGRHGLRRGQPRPGDAAGLLLQGRRGQLHLHATQLYTVTVNITGGDGYDTVTSSPAGLDCDSSGTLLAAPSGVHRIVPGGLRRHLDRDVLPYDSDVLARPDLSTVGWYQVLAGHPKCLRRTAAPVSLPPEQAEGIVPSLPAVRRRTPARSQTSPGMPTETLNFDAGLFVRDARHGIRRADLGLAC